MEGLSIVVFCTLVLGLMYSLFALILISLFFVGRLIYTFGYKISPKARQFGAPFVMMVPPVLMVANIVGLIILIIRAAKEVKNFNALEADLSI